MPNLASIVQRVFLYQTCLYWAKVGSDAYGKPVYADYTNPAQVAVRWEDKQQEILDSQGRKVIARAYVLTITPMQPGSLLFLGTTGPNTALADWQALPGYPIPPTSIQGGKEVLMVRTTPDLKAASYIYEVFM